MPEDIREKETTAYSRSPEQLKGLLAELIASPNYAYINKSTNPDISGMAVFKVDSGDNHADIGRTMETNVFSQSAGYEIDFLGQYFSRFDKNSIFFILANVLPGEEETLGILRVVDCGRGESETIDFFKEFNGEDTPLPPEMAGLPGEKIWDVMSVVVEPRHRDGLKSAWLYHALYKLSLDEGVDRWISNIVPGEIKNLRDRLGIPFKEVPGLDPVIDELPNGSRAEYAFYYAQVSELGPAVQRKVLELEAESDPTGHRKARINGYMAKLARIALNGRL